MEKEVESPFRKLKSVNRIDNQNTKRNSFTHGRGNESRSLI